MDRGGFKYMIGTGEEDNPFPTLEEVIASDRRERELKQERYRRAKEDSAQQHF